MSDHSLILEGKCLECNQTIRVRITPEDGGAVLVDAIKTEKKFYQVIRFCPYCRQDRKIEIPVLPINQNQYRLEIPVLPINQFQFSLVIFDFIRQGSLFAPSREFIATQIFHEGQELADEGKIEEAIKKLKESSFLFYRECFDKEKAIVDLEIEKCKKNLKQQKEIIKNEKKKN